MALTKDKANYRQRGMKFRERAVVLIATGCHVGNSPVAPGTLGSIAGLPFCFFVLQEHLWYHIIFIIGFMVFAVWIAGEAEKYFNQKDPGSIVIDEMTGVMVAFLGIPLSIETGLAGFVLFRFFDILKPFPIQQLERGLPGGTGIVADDVMAGVYANLALRMGIRLVSGEW